jgi:hypothetical protein
MKPTKFSLKYFLAHLPVIDDEKEVAKLIASLLVSWFSLRVSPVELHPLETLLLVGSIQFVLSLIDAMQKTQKVEEVLVLREDKSE